MVEQIVGKRGGGAAVGASSDVTPDIVAAVGLCSLVGAGVFLKMSEGYL